MFDLSREQQIKDNIQNILSSREFSNSKEQTSFLKIIAGWIREFLDWVRDQWSGIKFPDKKLTPPNELSAGSATGIKIIGILLILAILFAVMFFIIKILQKSRRIKQKEDATLLTVLKDPELIEQKALEFCTKGDFRQGLRFIYIALLLNFNEMNIIKIDKSKTNKQYLNEIRNIGYRHLDIVSQFTLDFNKYWYGNRKLDKEKFDFWYHRYTLLLKEGK